MKMNSVGRLAAVAVIGVLARTVPAGAQEPESAAGRSGRIPVASKGADYVVGPRDVLAITVWNQPTLSGRFTVEADGMIAFPLVGRVNAGGLTLRGVEMELSKRLVDGFFTKPEISVAIDEFRSQRIFVVGEVRQPGPYPLTGSTTLIEVLALVRSTTPEAAKQAVIVRPVGGAAAAGPVLPGQGAEAHVFTIDLAALEAGDLTNNMTLQNGDTLFVPRAATVVVFGQVRSPGVYPISSSTTVVQLLAQAGGVTDRGAANRVKIVRTSGGTKKELKARLDDVVKPGDTIVIPERLF
jgi:polysaccharide export outer membrane protein